MLLLKGFIISKFFWKGHLPLMRSKRFRQFISSFLIISFLFLETCFVAPAQAQLPIAASVVSFDDIQLNSQYGSLEEKFVSSKENATRSVILIQDAHGVYDAQKNIRNLIESFQNQYGFNLVGLEGGKGKQDHTLLRSFPDKKVSEVVVDRYLRRGELSGGEAAAILGSQSAIYYGLEDEELYFKNRNSFLKAIESKEQNLHTISLVKKKFDSIARKLFSKELQDFLREETYFLNHSKNLSSFLPTLFKLVHQYQIPLETNYPLLFQILQLNTDAAEDTLFQMEALSVYSEVEDLSWKLKENFVESNKADLSSAKKLLHFYSDLYRLKQLSSLEIARQEWDALQLSFDSMRTFLKDHGEDISLSLNLDAVMEFYREAIKRDRVLLDNLLEAMRKENQSNGIVVAGGFHMPGIAELLRAEGISYLVVSPQIQSVETEDNYHRVLRGDVSYKDTIQTVLATMGLGSSQQKFLEAYVDLALLEVFQQGNLDLSVLKSNWKSEIIQKVKQRGLFENPEALLTQLDEVIRNQDSRLKTEVLLESIKKIVGTVLKTEGRDVVRKAFQDLMLPSQQEEKTQAASLGTRRLGQYWATDAANGGFVLEVGSYKYLFDPLTEMLSIPNYTDTYLSVGEHFLRVDRTGVQEVMFNAVGDVYRINDLVPYNQSRQGVKIGKDPSFGNWVTVGVPGKGGLQWEDTTIPKMNMDIIYRMDLNRYQIINHSSTPVYYFQKEKTPEETLREMTDMVRAGRIEEAVEVLREKKDISTFELRSLEQLFTVMMEDLVLRSDKAERISQNVIEMVAYLNFYVIDQLLTPIERQEKSPRKGRDSWKMSIADVAVPRVNLEGEVLENEKTRAIIYYKQMEPYYFRLVGRGGLEQQKNGLHRRVTKMIAESAERKMSRGDFKAAIRFYYLFDNLDYVSHDYRLLLSLLKSFSVSIRQEMENETRDVVIGIILQGILSLAGIDQAEPEIKSVLSYIKKWVHYQMSGYATIVNNYPDIFGVDPYRREYERDQEITEQFSSRKMTATVSTEDFLNDILLQIDRVKSVKGLFEELLWTHNTSYETFKLILQSGYVKPTDHRGSQFRYGLDSEYGAIKIVMKRGFEEQFRGQGRNHHDDVDEIFYDLFQIARSRFKQAGMEEREMRRRIANEYDFRRQLIPLPDDPDDFILGDEVYLRSYFSPQLQIRKQVTLDNVQTILIPDHMFWDVTRFARDNGVPKELIKKFKRVKGTGAEEQYFAFYMDENKQEHGDLRQALKDGVRRPGLYYGNSSTYTTSKAAFQKEEAEYLRILAKNMFGQDESYAEETSRDGGYIPVTSLSNVEYLRIANSIFAKHGLATRQVNGWLYVKKGAVRKHTNDRKLWKLFLNPNPEHFYEVLDIVSSVLSEEERVYGKILSSNTDKRKSGAPAISDPNEPKFMFYIYGNDAKERLVRIVTKIEERISAEKVSMMALPQGVRHGYQQWGPSFTKKRNELIFYGQSGFYESSRHRIARGVDRKREQTELEKHYEGENFYLYKGEEDPFGSDPIEVVKGNDADRILEFLGVEEQDFQYVELSIMDILDVDETPQHAKSVKELLELGFTFEELKILLENLEDPDNYSEGQTGFALQIIRLNYPGTDPQFLEGFYTPLVEEALVRNTVSKLRKLLIFGDDVFYYRKIDTEILAPEQFPPLDYEKFVKIRGVLRGVDSFGQRRVINRLKKELKKGQLEDRAEETLAQIIAQTIDLELLKSFRTRRETVRVGGKTHVPEELNTVFVKNGLRIGSARGDTVAKRVVDRAKTILSGNSLGSTMVNENDLFEYIATEFGLMERFWTESEKKVFQQELMEQLRSNKIEAVEDKLVRYMVDLMIERIKSESVLIESLLVLSSDIESSLLDQKINQLVSKLLLASIFEDVTLVKERLKLLLKSVIKGVSSDVLVREYQSNQKAISLYHSILSLDGGDVSLKLALAILRRQLALNSSSKNDKDVVVVAHADSLPTNEEDFETLIESSFSMVGFEALKWHIYYTSPDQMQVKIVQNYLRKIKLSKTDIAPQIHFKRKPSVLLVSAMDQHQKSKKNDEALIYLLPDERISKKLKSSNVLIYQDGKIPKDLQFVKPIIAEVLVTLARVLEGEQEGVSRNGYLNFVRSMGFEVNWNVENQQYIVRFNLRQFVENLFEIHQSQRAVLTAA